MCPSACWVLYASQDLLHLLGSLLGGCARWLRSVCAAGLKAFWDAARRCSPVRSSPLRILLRRAESTDRQQHPWADYPPQRGLHCTPVRIPGTDITSAPQRRLMLSGHARCASPCRLRARSLGLQFGLHTARVGSSKLCLCKRRVVRSMRALLRFSTRKLDGKRQDRTCSRCWP